MLTILFPYTFVDSQGHKADSVAPLVDSLPSKPDQRGTSLVLTQRLGIFSAGLYQFMDDKGWVFVLDYRLICEQLFGVSGMLLCAPNTGDTLLPIGSSGASVLSVYRNGYLLEDYNANSVGIHLSHPAQHNDVYVVIQTSPIVPTGAILPEAPTDGNAYVRINTNWQNIQSSLNEGSYTGN